MIFASVDKMSVPRKGIWIMAQAVIAIILLAYAAWFTHWIANSNNRSPTPIDGTWDIQSVDGKAPPQDFPRTIYFEYNRAFMCVFRNPDGKLETHDFRVDPQLHSISITKNWLFRGAEIFAGNYQRTGDSMVLNGKYQGQPVTIVLVRRSMPIKDHS
jgi:hypothetical protein